MRSISFELKIILSFVFFTIFIIALERYQLSENIVEHFVESEKSKNSLLINTISPIIALNISLGLEPSNKEYLEQIIEQNPDLEFIEIKDAYNKLIYSYAKNSKDMAIKEKNSINFCTKEIVDTVSGENLGHVDLNFSSDKYKEVLSKNKETTIKIFFITSVLLAIFVFLIKKEFKSLKELSENVLSYDPKKNNFTLTPSKRLDEIGIIHNAIVSMVSRIDSHSKLLDDTNLLLEMKVKERTKKLDENNQLLSSEIKNKNLLLRELYHRVKNNLQIVSSLLSMQSRRLEDKMTKSIFVETNQRIKAMAMIHEKLYKSDDLEVVDMQVYTLDLVDNLRQSFQTKDVTFEIVCENFKLKLEGAVPMGLIINELVTNSIKYAFDERDINKIISVKMYTMPYNKFILEVYDNGKGADLEIVSKGFGFKLIEALASYQLKGIICSFNEDGLHHQIIFSKEFLI